MWGKHLLDQPEYAYTYMHNTHTYIFKYRSLHMRIYVSLLKENQKILFFQRYVQGFYPRILDKMEISRGKPLLEEMEQEVFLAHEGL